MDLCLIVSMYPLHVEFMTCSRDNRKTLWAQGTYLPGNRPCVLIFYFEDNMAKRFTETEKWRDPWFMELRQTDKLFWIYLLDNCDHAGIWQVNWKLVHFYFGKTYIPDFTAFDSRIIKISDKKWHIPKFIEFQYGELDQNNRAHLSVLKILKKEGASMDLVRSMYGRKDKDKDKDKDKEVVVSSKTTTDNGVVINNVTETKSHKPTIEEVKAYCTERGNNIDAQNWYDYYSANGWKVGRNAMKDWRAAVRTWERNNHTNGVVVNKPKKIEYPMCEYEDRGQGKCDQFAGPGTRFCGHHNFKIQEKIEAKNDRGK